MNRNIEVANEVSFELGSILVNSNNYDVEQTSAPIPKWDINFLKFKVISNKKNVFNTVNY